MVDEVCEFPLANCGNDAEWEITERTAKDEACLYVCERHFNTWLIERVTQDSRVLEIQATRVSELI